MARLNVNPTRMELKRLKARLSAAQRGHKLLRDKRDELVKRFLDIVRENILIREAVESELVLVNRGFEEASAVMSPEIFKQSLMCNTRHAQAEVSHKNIMGVIVPEYSFSKYGEQAVYSYGYAMTSGELDDASDRLQKILPQLLRLAQTEKAVEILSVALEKTRRRVNALEYVMIPRLEETIRAIEMKLDEVERGNLTRLMKVKDILIKERIEERKI